MNRLVLSPRAACMVAVFLAVVMTLSVLWGAMHQYGGQREVETRIHDCALILTRSGQQKCR